MIKKVIRIDDSLCTGCKKCVIACKETAIEVRDGKARLIREDFCDGLGDCLLSCPVNAIHIEEREIVTCKEVEIKNSVMEYDENRLNCDTFITWPIKIKLAPISSACYNNRDLLIVSDCAGYSYRNFYQDYRKENVLLIGCPKIDNEDYSERLSQIIKYNNVKSIKLLIMDVPCCDKMRSFVVNAIYKSRKNIPISIDVISKTGDVL